MNHPVHIRHLLALNPPRNYRKPSVGRLLVKACIAYSILILAVYIAA